MPRKPNAKCAKCPALSVEAAQAQGCWDAKKCHNRRTYYRHRAERIVERSERHRRRNGRKGVKNIQMPLGARDNASMRAEWVYYGSRKALHAIEALVFQDGKLIAHVEPVHTEGVHQKKLREWSKQVIALVRVQYGAELRGVTWQARELCPICGGKENEQQP